jgi:hypothetical protein
VFVHPNGKLGIRVRAKELTAQEIHGCEERFLASTSGL